MRIVFVAPRFHTNQTEWIHCLKSRGHELHMHVLLKGAIEHYEYLEPEVFNTCFLSRLFIRIFGKNRVNSFHGFPSPIDYFKRLKQIKPDILIVRDINRLFSLLAIFCGRLTGTKIVIYSQTALYKPYSKARRLVTWLILLIFNAAWMTPIKGNRTINKQPPSNMFFVPFAVPIIQKSEYPINDPIRLIAIGKFVARKNYLLLIEALKSLIDDGYDFSLKILGEVSTVDHEKELKKAKDLIEVLDIESKVKILTNISFHLMPMFYNEADLFVLPATSEPASISVLEAMGHGLPVICSNTCGTRWYIKDGITGIVFKDGSLESLALAIKCLMDRNKLKEMQVSAYENAVVELSAENFYSAFLEMIAIRFPKIKILSDSYEA